INLIFNAVDALPRGGRIGLRTRTQGDRTSLAVEDTGTGMTEEVRRCCLEPFFTTKGSAGSGLGLAMVHETIRRHHGTVEVASTPGAGTTLVVRLPALRAGERSAGRKGARADPVRPLRVLVVEDQPAIRRIVAAYLMK